VGLQVDGAISFPRTFPFMLSCLPFSLLNVLLTFLLIVSPGSCLYKGPYLILFFDLLLPQIIPLKQRLEEDLVGMREVRYPLRSNTVLSFGAS
jgi:hypothetical protein